MKTGVIFYSITGNTRAVAQKLVESMQKETMEVTLLEVKAASDSTNQTKVELTQSPEIKDFDRLIFASPVHGFSLSKVMKTYLQEINDLTKREVILFITHHFPCAWMGGNSSLKQMRHLIQEKNGTVKGMFSINWSSKKREEGIKKLIDEVIK